MTTQLLVVQPSERAPAERLGGQLLASATGGAVRPCHIETSPGTVLSWARQDAAGAFPPGQLDRDHLEQVHADIAQAWQSFAARFAALAQGELKLPVRAEDRRALPLLRS